MYTFKVRYKMTTFYKHSFQISKTKKTRVTNLRCLLAFWESFILWGKQVMISILFIERPFRLGNSILNIYFFFFTVTIFFSMKMGMLWWQILEVRFPWIMPKVASVSFSITHWCWYYMMNLKMDFTLTAILL